MKTTKMHINLRDSNNKSKSSLNEKKPKSSNKDSKDQFQNIYRCLQCNQIPLLALTENGNKVLISCPNNHSNEISLSNFLIQNTQNSIKCSICKSPYESKKEYKYCNECQLIFCKNCQKVHENTFNKKHQLFPLTKMDTMCILHKRDFNFYCISCEKNICDVCLFFHHQHQIISYKDITLTEKDIDLLKKKLLSENKLIKEIEEIFNTTIKSLKLEFENLIKHKKETLLFKTNIINIYENVFSNFQCIANINNITFTDKDFKYKPDMKDLDTLLEIFNYLNCEDSHENETVLTNTNNCDNNSKLNDNNQNNFDISDKRMTYKDFMEFPPLYEDDNDSNKCNSHTKLESNNDIKNRVEKFINKNNKNNIYVKQKLKQKNKIIKDDITNKIKTNFHNRLQSVDLPHSSTNNEINIPTLINNSNNTSVKNKSRNNVEKSGNKNKKKLYPKKISKNLNSYSNNDLVLFELKLQNNDKINNSQSNLKNPTTELDFNQNKINFEINDSNSNLDLNDSNGINQHTISFNQLNNLPKNFKKFHLLKSQISKKINENNRKSDGNFTERLPSIQNTRKYQKFIYKSPVISYFPFEGKNINFLNNVFFDNSHQHTFRNPLNEKDYFENNNFININNYNSSSKEKNNNQQSFNYDTKTLRKFKRLSDTPEELSSTLHEYNTVSNIDNFSSISNLITTKNKSKILKNKLLLKSKNELRAQKIINYINMNKKNLMSKKDVIDDSNNGSCKEMKYNLSLPLYIIDDKSNSQRNSSQPVSEVRYTKKNLEKYNNVFSKQNDFKNQTQLINVNNSQDYSNHPTLLSIINDSKEQLLNSDRVQKLTKVKENKINYNPLSNNPNSPKFNIQLGENLIFSDLNLEDENNDNIVCDINNIYKNINDDRKKEKNNVNIEFEKFESKSKNKDKDKKSPIRLYSKKDKMVLSEKIIQRKKNKDIRVKIASMNNNNNDSTSSSKIIHNKNHSINKNVKKKQTNSNKTKNNSKNTSQTKSPSNSNKFVKFSKTAKNFFKNAMNKSKFKTSINQKLKKMIKMNNSCDNILKHSIDKSDQKICSVNPIIFSEKIHSIKLIHGINCIQQINSNFLCIGDSIGDIKIFDLSKYKKILNVREHKGAINSLFLLHDNSILSSSSDYTMKKIKFKNQFKEYIVRFSFTGYKNIIFKGIELKSNHKILSCDHDNKLYLWEKRRNSLIKDDEDEVYYNTLQYNTGESITDILEFSKEILISISNKFIKFWKINDMKKIKSISNTNENSIQNSLCKLNENVLLVMFSHEVKMINVKKYNILNSIKFEQGILGNVVKLNDDSILIAETIDKSECCFINIKQYIFDDDKLINFSQKKEKYNKNNKIKTKEIRSLAQLSNNVIIEGINNQNNGKFSGEMIFLS